MTTTELDDLLGSDIIDVRDLIARFEDLETELADVHEDSEQDAVLHMRAEFDEIKTILDDLCGSGGDEQWRGDWYPLSLIADHHFEAYAQQLAEDIGAIPDDAKWPATCIDWEKAARELRMDYTAVEIGERTYWLR